MNEFWAVPVVLVSASELLDGLGLLLVVLIWSEVGWSSTVSLGSGSNQLGPLGWKLDGSWLLYWSTSGS